jgi:DNA-binding XRE family transcriptional regulator
VTGQVIERPGKVTPIATTVPALGRFKAAKVRQVRASRGVPALVPSDHVRAHVEQLYAWGFNDTAIAAAAGVSQKTIWFIRRGEYPTSQIDRAARILAVTHIPVPDQSGMMIPNIGTRRRIHALMAIGWTQEELGSRLGVTKTAISVISRNVHVRYETWRAIADMYEQLSGTPGPSDLLATKSRQRGFAVPMAWEGRDIDHPDHMPDPGAVTESADVDEVLLHRIMRGEYKGDIPKPERDAIMNHAVENGWTGAKVAQVLNLKKTTGDRALVRRRAKLRQKAA